MNNECWKWDETLYAQSAGYYLAGRLAYPKQLAAQIVSAVGLGSDSRALDVGCGPASLTLLLAPLVGQIVGIDADGAMIAQARRAAQQAGIGNVAWRHLRGEQLPADLGDFDLATFAQSLHWMKRVEVLGVVRTMLRAGGACVHIHATTNRGDESIDPLPRPRPPYEQIDALVRSHLGPMRRAGRSVRPSFAGGDEAEVYRAAGFDGPEQFTVSRGEVIERSTDQVVAATYSLSSSTPSLRRPPPNSKPISGLCCKPPRTTMSCSANERPTSTSTFGDLDSTRADIANPVRRLRCRANNREGREMPVDPRGEDLKRYINQDPGGPVVMLNLLKYRPGGEQSYRAYSAALKDYLPGIDAEVLYVGDCSTVLVAPAGWDWDAVLIVRYPSRRAFSEMVADPAYQAVTHLRTEALTEAVLQATVPWQTAP